MSAKNKRIVSYLQSNPKAKPSQVAKLFKTSVVTVYALKSKTKTAATKQSDWAKKNRPSTLVPNGLMSMQVYADDKINSPSHYKVGGIETIDFIEAKNLGYNLGNVVKYISRADHKDNKLDNLKKAQWYLNRAVSKLEA
jgi:hypothetical protein